MKRVFVSTRYVATEPHRIERVLPAASAGRTEEFIGVHGYCGNCAEPVVMDKLGRFRHVIARRIR
jgi:hypothetical protein